MPRLPRISGERAIGVWNDWDFTGHSSAAATWCCVAAQTLRYSLTQRTGYRYPPQRTTPSRRFSRRVF